ncbi:MAG: 3-dehydroquinate synthase [Gammaproteobacteria bacterium]|nr:3-dehydroquinate synthase [Gammaproteobacteria bacterium]
MKIINVKLGNPYALTIANGLLSNNVIAEFCKERANKIIIIADNIVAELYNQVLLNSFKKLISDVTLLTFPSGEQNKNRKTKEFLEDKILELGCGRDSLIVALGGGVTTDLAGFIAATYCRGIKAVYVPTTLLAMVDASIGGKTAVNTSFGKNLIGAFYQPQAVFIDPSLLQTLPMNELKNGMVEIIKHALIASKNEFDFIQNNKNAILSLQSDFLENMINQSCMIKKEIVEQDERDFGIRQLLNFGHTIGHALESVGNYELSHGEAVALGIVAESFISFTIGILSKQDFKSIRGLFRAYKIPVKLSKLYDRFAIKQALLLDKKSIEQKPRFVLIKSIGCAFIDNNNYVFEVPDHIIDDALDVILYGCDLC